MSSGAFFFHIFFVLSHVSLLSRLPLRRLREPGRPFRAYLTPSADTINISSAKAVFKGVNIPVNAIFPYAKRQRMYFHADCFFVSGIKAYDSFENLGEKRDTIQNSKTHTVHLAINGLYILDSMAS